MRTAVLSSTTRLLWPQSNLPHQTLRAIGFWQLRHSLSANSTSQCSLDLQNAHSTTLHINQHCQATRGTHIEKFTSVSALLSCPRSWRASQVPSACPGPRPCASLTSSVRFRSCFQKCFCCFLGGGRSKIY